MGKGARDAHEGGRGCARGALGAQRHTRWARDAHGRHAGDIVEDCKAYGLEKTFTVLHKAT